MKSIKLTYWSGNLGPFKFTLQRYIVSNVDVIIQRPWIFKKEKNNIWVGMSVIVIYKTLSEKY